MLIVIRADVDVIPLVLRLYKLHADIDIPVIILVQGEICLFDDISGGREYLVIVHASLHGL